MKKILTILFLFISTITFAQTPLVIKVSGSGSGVGNNDPDSLNGKAGNEYLLTVVANSGKVTGVSAGLVSIAYKKTNACGSSTASMTINVVSP